MKRPLLTIGRLTPRMTARLADHFTVHALAGADEQALLDAHGGDIVGVATTSGFPVRLFDALPKLEIISNYGVGYDSIPAAEAASRGIVVTHTPNVLNDEVANTAIALMLATSRRIVAYDKYVRAGQWKSEGDAPLTRGLAGKTVGILGLGRIGKAIAEKLAVFHCTVVYHTRTEKPGEPYRYYADLTEMARDCDYLVVITPGGAGTAKLVDRKVLEALGPDGTLINVARGTVIDEAEMVAALQDGRLGAAGLDVFEKEPHVPEALFALDNVVLVPHVGSATVETRQAMGDLVVDNLIDWFGKGAAITPVPECKHIRPK